MSDKGTLCFVRIVHFCSSLVEFMEDGVNLSESKLLSRAASTFYLFYPRPKQKRFHRERTQNDYVMKMLDMPKLVDIFQYLFEQSHC